MSAKPPGADASAGAAFEEWWRADADLGPEKHPSQISGDGRSCPECQPCQRYAFLAGYERGRREEREAAQRATQNTLDRLSEEWSVKLAAAERERYEQVQIYHDESLRRITEAKNAGKRAEELREAVRVVLQTRQDAGRSGFLQLVGRLELDRLEAIVGKRDE